MKKYKFVYLNKGMKFKREDDLKQCDQTLNTWIVSGWELVQLIDMCNTDGVCTMVAFMCKDEDNVNPDSSKYEYKFAYLNPSIKFSKEKDLEQSETNLNAFLYEGWQVDRIIAPHDGSGALIAFLYKENSTFVAAEKIV